MPSPNYNNEYTSPTPATCDRSRLQIDTSFYTIEEECHENEEVQLGERAIEIPKPKMLPISGSRAPISPLQLNGSPSNAPLKIEGSGDISTCLGCESGEFYSADSEFTSLSNTTLIGRQNSFPLNRKDRTKTMKQQIHLPFSEMEEDDLNVGCSKFTKNNIPQLLNAVDKLRTLSAEDDEDDETHTPPNPKDVTDFKKEFDPKGSMKAQVARLQSLRHFRNYDFTELQEERLIRFRTSAPSSNNEALLSGDHPLQTVPSIKNIQERSNRGRSMNSSERLASSSIPDRNRAASISQVGCVIDISRPTSGLRPNSLHRWTSQASNDPSIVPVAEQRSNHAPEIVEQTEEEEEEENKPRSSTGSSIFTRLDDDREAESPLTTTGPSISNNTQYSGTILDSDRHESQTLSTSELLRAFDQLHEQGRDRLSLTSNMNMLLPQGINTTISNTLFGSTTNLMKKNSVEETTIPKLMTQNGSRSTIGGYQRSPLIEQHPSTTSALLIQSEEFRKLQLDRNGENEDNSNWTVRVWNNIRDLFNMC